MQSDRDGVVVVGVVEGVGREGRGWGGRLGGVLISYIAVDPRIPTCNCLVAALPYACYVTSSPFGGGGEVGFSNPQIKDDPTRTPSRLGRRVDFGGWEGHR